MMTELSEQRPFDDEISENLHRVMSNINSACVRSGRNPAEVTLVAVSKTKPFSAIVSAASAGVIDFGENYVQELNRKMAEQSEYPDASLLRWHMIGHLQKNKIKYLLGRVTLIHSVDSVQLALAIDRESEKRNIVSNILLEVNVAREESKWGFDPEYVLDAARMISSFKFIRLLGLMTSAPYTEIPETNRPYFRCLRELGDEMVNMQLISMDSGIFSTPILSMGMSCDYETAIEEGATIVRVGTDIFGKRI